MTILRYGGLGSAEVAVIFIVLLLFLVPYILYLVTLQNTIKACAEHNRRMSPGEVWLVLIPLFGLIWYFIMVGRIADTIAAELRSRNMPAEEERPGYGVGLTLCILSCCTWIPVLGGLASLGVLICWIVYWVKIAGYKRKLEDTQFNFGQNPNQFSYSNQFTGQPYTGQSNPYMNQPTQHQNNPYMNQQIPPAPAPPPQNPWSPPNNPNPPQQ
jgi:amino acid transporter